MNYLFDNFKFDGRSKTPLSEQLFYHVLDKIFSYQVIPGEPFPAPEKVAKLLSTTVDVIQATYQQLMDERYVIQQDDSIMMYVSQHPEYLRLKTILDVEQFFDFHGLQGFELVVKDIKPAVIKQFDQWMLSTKTTELSRHLHRFHKTKHLNVYYSAIAMNSDYLPVQCDRCDELPYLLEHWRTFPQSELTTMVMFSINLPDFLANLFHVTENTPTFALRSSLLDQNGHMMATFMVVFSPRVFFNTNFQLNPQTHDRI